MDAAGPFANILHQDALRALSGQRAFERGLAYQRDGRVINLARKDGSLTATVCGSSEYAVKLWVHERGLAFSCTCPLARESTLCKHAVAVALAWLQTDATTTPGHLLAQSDSQGLPKRIINTGSPGSLGRKPEKQAVGEADCLWSETKRICVVRFTPSSRVNSPQAILASASKEAIVQALMEESAHTEGLLERLSLRLSRSMS